MERHTAPLAMGSVQTNKPGQSSVPSAIDRFFVKKLLEITGRPRIEIQLWDDSRIFVSDENPTTTLQIRSRSALYDLLKKVEIGFGDGYTSGQLDVEGDLCKFLCELYNAQYRVQNKSNLPLKLLLKLQHKKFRENSLSGSKSNIHHHYDLGNDFYALWLDQVAMQYTCAYFPHESMSIEQAQIAKMEHVCRKLMLQPGQTVVEAGCGWGGFALYMATNYGVKVKSYNISHEQIAYATERARLEGMADQVDYIEDDYRNIQGTYDVFVSIGMLEHVGKQNFRQLGSVVDRCLASNGLALIHSIGRNAPVLMSAWTEKRIFPGAYPPTIREMMDIVEPFNFSVLDIENLRLHYAKTLEHWLHRFNENEDTVLNMFDERFVRTWRLYLTGSIATFLVGSLQLFQMVFARGEDNRIAMSRQHQYPQLER